MAQEGAAARRKIDPAEMWKWMDEFHWQHFHGIWINWRMSSSMEVARTYRSIRSFQSHADDRSVVLHRNDWHDPSAAQRKWMIGPWLISRQEHCVADGIVHPAIPISRTLIFPNGDLAWMPLDIDFPQRPVTSEVHFMLPTREGRVAIIFSYNIDESVSASQILEEARDSNERPGDSWQGSVWDHKLATVPLETGRQEPAGKFVGEEMTLVPSGLELTTTKDMTWEGFKRDQHSILVHMPYGFTACVPLKVEVGREFPCTVHWVVKDDEIRRISWKYSAERKLEYIKSAAFHKL